MNMLIYNTLFGWAVLDSTPVNSGLTLQSRFYLMSNLIIRAWTNRKCLATKHHETLFGDQTF